MATQQDFYNQLASIYDPQVQSIQAQQALLPAQAEAQTSALEQARTNAFKKIDNTASARGMTFSGFSPDQQATYTGATYLPALANVKLSQNQANLKLIDALNGINANRGTQAMNMYQSQQNALADANAKVEAARIAAASRASSGSSSGSTATIDPGQEFLSYLQNNFKAAGGAGNPNVSRQTQDAWANAWFEQNGVSKANRQQYWNLFNQTYNRADNPTSDWRYAK